MSAHGLKSTYNSGCRCDPCTDANTAANKKQRQRRAQIAATDPTQVPHGFSGYFNWNCRCDICKQAGREHFVGDWDTSNVRQPWTADDARLALRDDLPVWEIARKLKRPYQAVVRKRQALRRASA